MRKNFFLLLIILGFLSLEIGCNGTNGLEKTKQPIVKVYNEYLYPEDISNILPQGISEEDSINFVQTYINNWIQNQLMLHFAEEYLQSQKEEIEKKTNDFKNSLLIHQFKQKLVNKNTDDNLNSTEIETYYNSHYSEFKLNNSIIKGFFVKIPNNSADIENFKTLLNSSYERDFDEIISYVNSVNGSFDDFTKTWVNFSSKIMKMPIAIENPDNFLRNNKSIQVTDNGFYYFLLIMDYAEKGKTAPIEYAQKSIVKILQKQQSNAIIDKFKKEKYKTALQEGNIEFYK